MIDEGLDAVIVNPTGIIGPVDAGPSRVNRLLRLASRGRLPVVLAGGFDWVDVRDVALGLDGGPRPRAHGRELPHLGSPPVRRSS